MYTHYYSYYNLSLLNIKKMRIYLELVNPTLDYIIIILCAITTKLYLEVQLCTTSKAVNHTNQIYKMIQNVLVLLYVWKASLLFMVMSYKNEIINVYICLLLNRSYCYVHSLERYQFFNIHFLYKYNICRHVQFHNTAKGK